MDRFQLRAAVKRVVVDPFQRGGQVERRQRGAVHKRPWQDPLEPLREGDGKVPEGEYYVCTKNEQSKFTLFLGLSYPNIEDAKKGLEQGLISEQDYARIEAAIREHRRPDWETALGGKIGIHGKGSSFDWTAGCIALEDEDIRDLWTQVELGDKVTIYK